MTRTVTIDLFEQTPNGESIWTADCSADGEQWARAESGDKQTAIDQALHYARVHLSDPPMPFGALREVSPDYDPEAA